LSPPAAPRPDATLCDEANVSERVSAYRLFQKAIERGLVSASTAYNGMPKQLWVVDDSGQVYEAMFGGSGSYHGYPIRRSDPFFQVVIDLWNRP
jgi:hypothetical protein